MGTTNERVTIAFKSQVSSTTFVVCLCRSFHSTVLVLIEWIRVEASCSLVKIKETRRGTKNTLMKVLREYHPLF